jgi:multidrug efflux pump subunit AcrA (membrane-fusion protein)
MGRYREAARAAAELTNKELGARITELAPINMARLQELLPTKRDKEDFVALMRVVEDETELENQLSFLRDNLATAGKVALKALKLFV